MNALRLGCIAALLCACSGDDERAPFYTPPLHPIPGCEALDPASCDVSDAGCRTRLLEIAACLRGDEPGEMPPVVEMSEREFGQFLRDYYDEHPPDEDPVPFENALGLLGLTAPGSLGVERAIERAVENVYGLYRSETKEIFVIDHDDGSDAFDRVVSSSVLVHEFVHLLQDRQLGLEALSDAYADSLDNAVALTAMLEGEADLHRMRFAASTLGVDPNRVNWEETFQSGVDAAKERLTSNPSPFISTREEFPYAWGARYANHLWRRGGLDALAERWGEPPRTSYEFLASADAVVELDFTPLELEAPQPSDGWELQSSSVLGAWGVYLVVQRHSSLAAAETLSLAWRGDLLSVFVRAGSTPEQLDTAVVYQTASADESAAASLEARLAGAFDPGAAQVSVDDRGALFTLALSSDGSDLAWVFQR